MSGGGGFIADAPVHRAYWISQGDWMLCDTARDDSGTPDDTITITRVRYGIGRHRPMAVRTYLRTVTPHQVRTHPHAPDGAYGPFGSMLGRPPRFAQSYADPRWPAAGRYTRPIAGTTVSRGCNEVTADAVAAQHGDVPQHRWQSLVLAVKVGRFGGRVARTFVDYTTGDTEHTLRIDWTVGGQGYRNHR